VKLESGSQGNKMKGQDEEEEEEEEEEEGLALPENK